MTDEFYQCTDCCAVDKFTSRIIPFIELSGEAKATLKKWFVAAYPSIAEQEIDDPMLATYYGDEASDQNIAEDLCSIYPSCSECGSTGPFVLHSYIEQNEVELMKHKLYNSINDMELDIKESLEYTNYYGYTTMTSGVLMHFDQNEVEL